MNIDINFEINKNRLALEISNILLSHSQKPIFLCVGSDKIIGDLLAPIVGELLTNKYKINGFVYGNLDKPVHNKNLKSTMLNIAANHPNAPIILVDGILGEQYELGLVKFHKCGGVAGGEFNQGLYVGNYSLLGVVEIKGIAGLQFLKNVRLNNIVKMANFIADSINIAYKYCGNLA